MFDAARGKRPMPSAEELRAWALKLGTPAAGEPTSAPAPTGWREVLANLRGCGDGGSLLDAVELGLLKLEHPQQWACANGDTAQFLHAVAGAGAEAPE
jgi:hypothetical protein